MDDFAYSESSDSYWLLIVLNLNADYVYRFINKDYQKQRFCSSVSKEEFSHVDGLTLSKPVECHNVQEKFYSKS
jgi:hypothetical protein